MGKSLPRSHALLSSAQRPSRLDLDSVANAARVLFIMRLWVHDHSMHSSKVTEAADERQYSIRTAGSETDHGHRIMLVGRAHAKRTSTSSASVHPAPLRASGTHHELFRPLHCPRVLWMLKETVDCDHDALLHAVRHDLPDERTHRCSPASPPVSLPSSELHRGSLVMQYILL